MNYGKISESVFDRTVYKTIQTLGYHDIEKIDGAGLGTDCAILASSSHSQVVQAVGSAFGRDPYLAARAILDACNKIAAYGVNLTRQRDAQTNIQISLQISISKDMREAKLRAMLQYMANLMKQMQMPIVNVQAQVVPDLVHHAIANAFVIVDTKDSLLLQGKAKPHQDVVMTKWMALEGTTVLSTIKMTELSERYPLNLLEQAIGFEQFLSVIPEAAIATGANVSAMQVVRDGGIFGGLWQLAQSSGVGLSIDLKKISVKQETIEVCEFFDVNPYQLLSGGSLLMTTDHGAHLVTQLEQAGIFAAVIGKTTADHDRVIRNEEETRFLEPAREDEIFKVN